MSGFIKAVIFMVVLTLGFAANSIAESFVDDSWEIKLDPFRIEVDSSRYIIGAILLIVGVFGAIAARKGLAYNHKVVRILFVSICLFVGAIGLLTFYQINRYTA